MANIGKWWSDEWMDISELGDKWWETSRMDWLVGQVVIGLPEHVLGFHVFEVASVSHDRDFLFAEAAQSFNVEVVGVQHCLDLVDLSQMHWFGLRRGPHRSKRVAEDWFMPHVPYHRHSVNGLYLLDRLWLLSKWMSIYEYCSMLDWLMPTSLCSRLESSLSAVKVKLVFLISGFSNYWL